MALWYDVLNCLQSSIKVIRWIGAKYIRHTAHTMSIVYAKLSRLCA